MDGVVGDDRHHKIYHVFLPVMKELTERVAGKFPLNNDMRKKG